MKAEQFLVLFKNAYQEYNGAQPCPVEYCNLLKDTMDAEITKDNIESIKVKLMVRMLLKHYTTVLSLKLLNLFDIVSKEAGLYLHDNDEKKKLKM